jgi:hypothetical protein
MKFDESSAPEPLDYDFRAWGVDAHGRVPEPTDGVLGDFLKFFDDLTEDDLEERFRAEANALNAAQEEASKVRVVGALPDMPADVAPPVPEKMPERRTWRQIILGDEEKTATMAHRIGDLCQNQPSGDEICALPHRIRHKFITAVIAMFVMGDETGGLSPAAATSNSPAAGNADSPTT